MYVSDLALNVLRDHIITAEAFVANIPVLVEIADAICATLDRGGKLLLCGNGGSAADCQHIAAELTGRFEASRSGLAAVALTTDTSALTAIANDFGYDQVFARQVGAIANDGDTLLAISTSGNSSSIVNAAITARGLGVRVIGFTGSADSLLSTHSDLCLRVPSTTTARIQEMHILAGHIICKYIDDYRFSRVRRSP